MATVIPSRFKALAIVLALVSIISLGTTYHYLYKTSAPLPGTDIQRPDDAPPAPEDMPKPEDNRKEDGKEEDGKEEDVPKPEDSKWKQILPWADNLDTLKSIHTAPDNISTTVFMFRGDFSSPLYDLFVLHKRAVKFCDKGTAVAGCDVRLPEDYKWGTLSSKLLDALDVMCKSDKKTDFYVKVDDDLIMSEARLEEMIRKMATTDCQVAGGIAVDYQFYWPTGQVYIFKRAVLDEMCAKLSDARGVYSSEDITFGYMLNSTDKGRFCDIEKPVLTHWHKEYKDKRIKIEYHIQHNE
ncbi:hypothetical protein GGI25_006492 [Coemansia spiralis]|uniref:Uncharacterized protein n=2 Tax=Coemansia TaxID=4863 RepID=A0A9W8G0A4_9FUNG|nr:hypothetical protein BX070DRAFT_252387 [Coemansia spiralis]KAI9503824.1 hypothetical protein BX070DRAFT_141409 [Coemansia spiralis]KAJ1985789.1 hypothetical protein EDC05_006499 [Coemansia umbellata]KAJ2618465.1 hypothetical protein GGI26_006547 [Coemansia sp. RSA 1358]KAJ2668080.1 hypothetical protein GGI25_006492 [Coemansia spiralis]